MLNNIKSNLVLKIVFRHLKKRKKLPILKYNKNLKNKLKIQLKDYQEYLSLKAFNEKYQTKFENTNIEKLKIVGEYHHPLIDDEGLKDIIKMEFTELKELILSHNKITDLEPLLNMKFEKLEVLTLSDLNEFKRRLKTKKPKKEIKPLNLSILKKIQFPNLNVLNLSGNNGIDITSLENINFNKLKELYLRSIGIQNLEFLSNFKFSKLEKLELSGNSLKSINGLDQMNLDNLKYLYLSSNQISDFKVFENINFENLLELDLSWNRLLDITFFEKCKFPRLEHLSLNRCGIITIAVLEKVSFDNLKELDLEYNEILDITILEKIKFEKIEKINLRHNIIQNITVLKNLELENLKHLDLSDNNIMNISVLDNLKLEKLDSLDISFNVNNKKINKNLISKLKSKYANFNY